MHEGHRGDMPYIIQGYATYHERKKAVIANEGYLWFRLLRAIVLTHGFLFTSLLRKKVLILFQFLIIIT